MDVDLMAYGYSRALWLPQYDMWVSPDERIVSGEEALREVPNWSAPMTRTRNRGED